MTHQHQPIQEFDHIRRNHNVVVGDEIGERAEEIKLHERGIHSHLRRKHVTLLQLFMQSVFTVLKSIP